jgi:hypothetical protein
MKTKELLELNKFLCSKTDCSLYEPEQKELDEFLFTKDFKTLKSRCGCNMLIANKNVLKTLIVNFEEHLERDHFVEDQNNNYRLNLGLIERNLKWYNQLYYYAYRKIKKINKLW